MSNLQKIDNQQSKHNEIIKYLTQDNGYWLENDKWDITKEFFIGKTVNTQRYIDFSNIKSTSLKN